MQFYSEVKTWLIKLDAGNRVANGEPISDSIRNALGKLVVDSAEATGVIDIYRQAGIVCP